MLHSRPLASPSTISDCLEILPDHGFCQQSSWVGHILSGGDFIALKDNLSASLSAILLQSPFPQNLSLRQLLSFVTESNRVFEQDFQLSTFSFQAILKAAVEHDIRNLKENGQHKHRAPHRDPPGRSNVSQTTISSNLTSSA